MSDLVNPPYGAKIRGSRATTKKQRKAFQMRARGARQRYRSGVNTAVSRGRNVLFLGNPARALGNASSRRLAFITGRHRSVGLLTGRLVKRSRGGTLRAAHNIPGAYLVARVSDWRGWPRRIVSRRASECRFCMLKGKGEGTRCRYIRRRYSEHNRYMRPHEDLYIDFAYRTYAHLKKNDKV